MTMTPDGCCLELGRDRVLRQSGAVVGAAGLRTVEIQAVTASPCALALAYRRPWEQAVPAASELTYRFLAAPEDTLN
jgi:predicted secreted protein